MANHRMHTSMSKLSTQYHGATRFTTTVAALLLAVMVVAAGCGGDSATGPTSPQGAYLLTSVQAKPLPYRLYADAAYSVDVSAGTIELNTDGSFMATLRTEERVDNHLSVYADTATGKWTLVGTKVDLVLSDGSRASGTWAGRTLTVADSSSTIPVVYLYSLK